MTFSSLAHHRAGSGEPLILVHGIGHRRQAWYPVFDRLAERYDVIAVDLPGFGESPALPDGVPHTVAALADQLEANFAAWGITRPHIAGNSLGGAVSLELARRGTVASATALSPASFLTFSHLLVAAFPLTLMRIASFATPRPVLRLVTRSASVRRILGWPLYMHPERHDAESTYGDALAMKNARGFERTMLRCITPAFRPFRGPLRAPVTIAWGTRDRLLLPSEMKRARKLLPQVRYVELIGAGHVPMGDCPDQIFAVINETTGAAAQPASDVA
ncbi:alpha/beta fold hydrolase [Nocardioides cavernaquae]|uniref:Alpha/beta hydrolase n=1 Tax=Nocardioides cavernaquae TaxID=2321396 RepID=A0A3A5HC69_9ACTN|nr:alpha/beta hydrolase [Nocardioides cavernaquae]RJS45650.1 alpha/beta hydrolase [Nocardioides cavernaquae]